MGWLVDGTALYGHHRVATYDCAGVESEQLVFVFKGQVLGDTVPVATILDCGGHVGVARRGVAIEFDPDTLVCGMSVAVACCCS